MGKKSKWFPPVAKKPAVSIPVKKVVAKPVAKVPEKHKLVSLVDAVKAKHDEGVKALTNLKVLVAGFKKDHLGHTTGDVSGAAMIPFLRALDAAIGKVEQIFEP